jgi:hypothetical protein
MRALGGLVGLLITLGIGLFIYKYELTQASAPGVATPVTTIDLVGVKNDLLAIAQSERIYQTEHNSFGSLSDLTSSGAMSMPKTGRDGYTYDVEIGTDDFHVVAHCPTATMPGCMNYSIDQTMEIQTAAP